MKLKYTTTVWLVLIIVISSLFSCKKYLDETVYSNIAASNFWANKEDALSGLYSNYALSTEFGAHNRMFFVMTDMLSDDMDDEYSNTEAERRQLQNYNFSPFNSYINNSWVALYKSIAQSNVIINKVPNISSMTANDKNIIIGEAKFLRALEYLYLVQLWGDIPLDTISVGSIEETKMLKSPAATIYNFIVRDLKFAEDNCSDAPLELGRASKWAAKSLLAKVYLTMAGPFSNRNTEYLTLSEAKLKEVVNSKRFSLVPKIIDYFDINKKGSSEMIYDEWQIGDASGDIGSFMHRNALPSSISDPAITQLKTAGYKAWSPTPDLWSNFKPQDDRLKMYFSYYIKKNSNGTFGIQKYNVPYIAKYVDSTTVARDAKANNLPVLRYADVLLMYAEVLNELGTTNSEDGNKNQYDYLNMVRQRAFSTSPSTGKYNNMSFTKIQFRDIVMLERRLELAHEGQRLFDMKRTGTFISGMTALANNTKALLAGSPVPTYSIAYPAGVYPNPTGKTPYPAGTVVFTADFLKNTKTVPPADFQFVMPIPGNQIQVFDIGQNKGYN
ncbi:MAG: RagB/SusD family nutrient uptake outer membrane protein [Candidatus Pedobacter colombiensis]|uniref:RagB/SusD family nutrient uptake outer membrane protein n=1 Tax=Candidatus Pedobacter colombiensis TaxID=3121371 RepID=A0AAJ6B7R9_9SPHI|nr:RagB/SusD family nutrient uptake outer membrane protein [Pedobacter sp.]WEK21377.1 MAG: RagB/SusD family nutrient uptake outer membrane protein [Pedobacter sp.]